MLISYLYVFIILFDVRVCVQFSGVAESLKALLSDPDGTVRHKATEALYIISGKYIGPDP